MALEISKAEAVAMTKGKTLAAQVERLRHGLYTVPSQSEPGVRWTVVDTGTGLQCTCTAGMLNRPCAHAAAVVVRRQQEARPATPVQPRGGPAKRVALL
jgi:hypothetical protein